MMISTRSLLALGLLATISHHAAAQTRFLVSKAPVELSRYRNGEECLAAVKRVTHEMKSVPVDWHDTLPKRSNEAFDSLAAQVRTTAHVCVAKFNPDSVAVAGYPIWAPLYLAAGRDDAAEVIVRRLLASIPPRDIETRMRTLAALGNIYSGAQPVRLERIKAFMREEDALLAYGTFRDSIKIYAGRFLFARHLRDTAFTREMSTRLLRFAESITREQRTGPVYDSLGKGPVRDAYDFLSHRALLDSLRRGPDAYLALKRVNWSKATGGEGPETYPDPVGQQAPPLTADFWFTRASPADTTQPLAAIGAKMKIAAPTRPTPNRVSLVVFLQGGCRDETPATSGRQSYRSPCWDTYAILHRFAARYPSLEMTLLAHTVGYVGDANPVNPADEAHLLAGWWLGGRRLPVTLGVATTEFYRLPMPDNRRVDKAFPNWERYQFGKKKFSVQVETAYVIDKNGIIVYATQLGRETETEITELLDAMVR